jgi:predicted ATP-grasp superfamily ATP-dependent carboligase
MWIRADTPAVEAPGNDVHTPLLKLREREVARLELHDENDGEVSLEQAARRQPGVLLTSAGYIGTLAAVRSFGRHGIPTVVADSARLGPASWSRYVGRRALCPPQSSSEHLVAWLLQFGKDHPGHALCATSDDTAWIYSKHRDELSEHFFLYQPSVEAVYTLLNKRQLAIVAHAEGLEFPRTWFPQSVDDAKAVADDARFPVLIKPVTQILHSTHSKGQIVDRRADLPREFAAMAREPYKPELLQFDPNVGRPLVQEFQPEAARGIYGLSGFIDQSGELLGVRAARKILQRPRRLGVGLCFERAEVKPALVDALVRVCRRVGYYGVFEVEFIESDGRDLLIDFNPRFYGQMAFDIARGLPVSLFAYYAALGDHIALRRLANDAHHESPRHPDVYCNLIDFEILLRAQRLSGALSADEARHWRNWYKSHRGRVVHAVFDRDDWKPAIAEIVRQLIEHGRHPRAFVKSTVLKSILLGLEFQLFGI